MGRIEIAAPAAPQAAGFPAGDGFAPCRRARLDDYAMLAGMNRRDPVERKHKIVLDARPCAGPEIVCLPAFHVARNWLRPKRYLSIDDRGIQRLLQASGEFVTCKASANPNDYARLRREQRRYA